MQYSSVINNAGYPNFPYPYQSPVKVEHIVWKARNHSSINIINMVKVLNVGVISKKLLHT
jgi:hypothetical protein